ncbi:hypothetical protein SAMN05421509_101147 [Chromohalobacter canadensis]|uniref:Uncharacterized protein n=1 Tax=Chromohalobacter canadensis TaxID=141389 RepID=A0A285VAG5_9GAMM|nr:hypothetical protein SAMN05421509_101147 [Chromohalobacter canadensis]
MGLKPNDKNLVADGRTFSLVPRPPGFYRIATP